MHYRINAASFHSLKDPDLPSDKLFRQAEAVVEMLDSPGWRIVMGLVDEAKELTMLRLTTEPLDHPGMARLAGLAEGTRAAEAAARAVIDRADAVRNDDELERLASRGAEEAPPWS